MLDRHRTDAEPPADPASPAGPDGPDARPDARPVQIMLYAVPVEPAGVTEEDEDMI